MDIVIKILSNLSFEVPSQANENGRALIEIISVL